MDTAIKPENQSLEVRRTFKASPQQVFNAWATKDALAKWIGPANEMDVDIEAHDFCKGGEFRYRLTNKVDDQHRGPAGLSHVAAGEFVEITQPHRLIFTWRWVENGMDIGDTLVTVDIAEKNGNTELVLRHERLPSAEAREAHNEGWQGWLTCLQEYLQ